MLICLIREFGIRLRLGVEGVLCILVGVRWWLLIRIRVWFGLRLWRFVVEEFGLLLVRRLVEVDMLVVVCWFWIIVVWLRRFVVLMRLRLWVILLLMIWSGDVLVNLLWVICELVIMILFWWVLLFLEIFLIIVIFLLFVFCVIVVLV